MSGSSYLTEARFLLAEMRRHLGKQWWTLDMYGTWIIQYKMITEYVPRHVKGAYEPLPKTGARGGER